MIVGSIFVWFSGWKMFMFGDMSIRYVFFIIVDYCCILIVVFCGEFFKV